MQTSKSRITTQSRNGALDFAEIFRRLYSKVDLNSRKGKALQALLQQSKFSPAECCVIISIANQRFWTTKNTSSQDPQVVYALDLLVMKGVVRAELARTTRTTRYTIACLNPVWQRELVETFEQAMQASCSGTARIHRQKRKRFDYIAGALDLCPADTWEEMKQRYGNH